MHEGGTELSKLKEKKVQQPDKLVRLDSLSSDMDDGDESYEFNHKTVVECLCPCCGKKHLMNFHWIGRGVPRKFCKSCRPSY